MSDSYVELMRRNEFLERELFMLRQNRKRPEEVYHEMPVYPSIREIQIAVCQEFNISLSDMLSASRSWELSKARHAGYLLALRMTGKQVSQVARAFNRDHSTVTKSATRLAAKMQSDAVLKDKIDRIKWQIAGVYGNAAAA